MFFCYGIKWLIQFKLLEMIIVLMGYMGSGKSAVGKALSEVLDYDFIDLDHFIELAEKMTIPEIFESQGEIYFRRVEAESLVEVLNNSDKVVLSLGGGTPCYGKNLEVIKSHEQSRSFYLKTSIKNLTSRIMSEMNTRPLVAHLDSEEGIVEYIGKHLFERVPYYNEADYIIDTDNNSISELVERIVLTLF